MPQCQYCCLLPRRPRKRHHRVYATTPKIPYGAEARLARGGGACLRLRLVLLLRSFLAPNNNNKLHVLPPFGAAAPCALALRFTFYPVNGIDKNDKHPPPSTEAFRTRKLNNNNQGLQDECLSQSAKVAHRDRRVTQLCVS